MNDGRTARMTFPTASFSLTTDLILFIHEQADRLGTSKSGYLRSLLFREMAQEHETNGLPIGAPVADDDAV